VTRCTVIALLAIALALPWAGASASTIYKWTDSNGVVHYADHPAPGSHKVDVGSPQTVPAGQVPKDLRTGGNGSSGQQGANHQAAGYRSLSLTHPSPKQTIRNNQGKLGVVYSLQPHLRVRRGDRVEVLLDGKVVKTTAGGSVTLGNIDRGTHTVRVQVVDHSGKTLIRSSRHTFYMKRAFIHRNNGMMMNRAPAMPTQPAAP